MDNQILFMTTKMFTSNLELIVFAHFLFLFIYSHVETLFAHFQYSQKYFKSHF
jgi:hypothetical protein